jgi:aminoglycoside phosphotransferase (APT) family kinase protein
MREHLAAVTDAQAAPAPLSALHAADLYRQARAGFYNDNVRVDTSDGPVIVRIPIHGADMMDLRIWPEQQVLDAVAPYVREVPRVLHVSADPAFQVHEFIDGSVLHDLAPRGVAVPENVPSDVARLFGALATVPRNALPETPAGWPGDGDSSSFATALSDVTAGRWARFRDGYGSLYRALGVPVAPLAPALDGWRHLTPRPFRLLHCDVHRKNIIMRDGHAVFLDWELALWGDPVYDLAVHLHKMTYLPDEERALTQAWSRALPSALTEAWESDVTRYLVHERIKSVIVDTVRYAKLVATPTTPREQVRTLVQSLTRKLNAAGAIWGWSTDLDAEAVGRILGQEAH